MNADADTSHGSTDTVVQSRGCRNTCAILARLTLCLHAHARSSTSTPPPSVARAPSRAAPGSPSSTSPAATPPSRSNGRRCAWPGSPEPTTRTPWVNHLVDAVREGAGLEHGVTLPIWDALRRGEAPDLLTLAQKAASGGVRFEVPQGKAATAAGKAGRTAIARGIRTIDRQRAARDRLIARHGNPPRKPWIYLIAATGDI